MAQNTTANFEQPIILEKPAILSRLFMWIIMLVTSSSIIWSYFAEIDQSIPATGQLELKDGAREVQAPTTGTVVRLHVENGDRVEKNQPILTFRPTAPKADLDSLLEAQEAFQKENQFYQDLLEGRVRIGERPDLEALAKDRKARQSETDTYEALINELYRSTGRRTSVEPDQRGLYDNAIAEYNSRVGAIELQVQELQKQLEQSQQDEAAARERLRVAQTQLEYSRQQLQFARQQLDNSSQQIAFANQQLENSRQQLEYAQEQLKNTEAQLQYSQEQLGLAKGQLTKSEQVLESNQEILDKISPLVEEGAIAELQQKRQQQEVIRGESELLGQRDRIEARSADINSRLGEINSRKAEINNRQGDVTARLAEIKRIEGDINSRQSEVSSRLADINARQGEVESLEAEIRRSQLEQERIDVSIARTREQLQNTKDAWARDLYNRIAANKTAIAGIDSQFSKLQLDNKKRLTEINAQVQKLKQTRNDQVLKSPVSGIIFDLTPGSKEESSLDMATDPICQYVIQEILEPGEIKPEKCEDANYEAQQTQPLLTILDDDEGLEAVVYIQNKDIALVLNALQSKRDALEPLDGQELAGGEVIDCKPGKSCTCPELRENREKLGLSNKQCVPVELQVQALPANEFGTVSGEVVSISKDAIPPDPQKERPFFSFETKINLSRQTVMLDRESDLEIGLQNGMAVNSNIKVGKRSVLELFFSRFTSKFKSLTNVN